MQENAIHVMKDSGLPFKDKAADLCGTFWSLSIGRDRGGMFWSSGSVMKRLERFLSAEERFFRLGGKTLLLGSSSFLESKHFLGLIMLPEY